MKRHVCKGFILMYIRTNEKGVEKRGFFVWLKFMTGKRHYRRRLKSITSERSRFVWKMLPPRYSVSTDYFHFDRFFLSFSHVLSHLLGRLWVVQGSLVCLLQRKFCQLYPLEIPQDSRQHSEHSSHHLQSRHSWNENVERSEGQKWWILFFFQHAQQGEGRKKKVFTWLNKTG